MADDLQNRESSTGKNGLTATTEELCLHIEQLRSQLGSELGAARIELTECRMEAERLRTRLENFEQEHRRVCEGYSALEAQIAELGSLYVTTERIHGTVEHHEVLAAIQDVVINIIGSEDLAIYEFAENGQVLLPTQCFGVEGRNLGPVALGEGLVGRAAAERWSWVIGDGAPPRDHPDLTACVPLEVAGRVVGVLVIWRMLGHKPVFGPSDRKVLGLLTTHAATALYLTSLHSRQ